MLEQILRECNNWFVVPNGVHTGRFTVENGRLALPFLQNNQYFRVIGSVFNDGLHKYTEDLELTEETFTGAVWALAIPKAVISLGEKATEWETKNGAQAAGPFQSESFCGYSYTKATGANGGAMTWKDAFSGELSKWRKL